MAKKQKMPKWALPAVGVAVIVALVAAFSYMPSQGGQGFIKKGKYHQQIEPPAHMRDYDIRLATPQFKVTPLPVVTPLRGSTPQINPDLLKIKQ